MDNTTQRHPLAPGDGLLVMHRSVAFIQATRTEPAREVRAWLLHTPVGPVSCPDLLTARHLAETFGCKAHWVQ